MLNRSREQSNMAKVGTLEVFSHSVNLFISSLSSGTIFSKPRAPGLLRVVFEGLCTQFSRCCTFLSQKKWGNRTKLVVLNSYCELGSFGAQTLFWEVLTGGTGESLGVYILPGNSDVLLRSGTTRLNGIFSTDSCGFGLERRIGHLWWLPCTFW